jgi:hypothetical protein
MSGLKKWFRENWVDIGAPKKGGGYEKCGRAKADGSGRPYPKCVPAAKAASMSASQRRSAVIRKRAAGNVGPKPTNVKTIKASEGKMLKGKQKKLDANKDGKITGEDFSMLKKSKKVRMQKKDAMGGSPEGMMGGGMYNQPMGMEQGGMSITRGQNKNVQAKLVTFKGVF